jgi:hypothetical protein
MLLKLYPLAIVVVLSANLNAALGQEARPPSPEVTVPNEWSLTARLFGTTHMPGNNLVVIDVYWHGTSPRRLDVRQGPNQGGKNFNRELTNEEAAELYRMAIKAIAAHQLGAGPATNVEDGSSVAFQLHSYDRSVEIAVHHNGELGREAGLLLRRLNALVPDAFRIHWQYFDRETQFERLENSAEFFIPTQFFDQLSKLPAAEKNEAIDRLKKSLEAETVEVRRRAALALHAMGDRSGVPVMIRDLATAKGHDRNNVIVALRVMKDERAIPALVAAVEDPSPYVRTIAIYALGEMRVMSAYEVIAKHVTDNETYGDDVPSAPANAACDVLGQLGDKRAIPLLIEQLDARFSGNSAARALNKLTGQDFGRDEQAWSAWWAGQNK